ncbi:unnamed protein product [Euphydryas editha]|uniref:Uncharacterized protein n=1 Tax=Euphydryas editha TaxID=104508 RepID=A0AAU9UH85_EUPED|nr:unnamed protein product [Euphydryas editha]
MRTQIFYSFLFIAFALVVGGSSDAAPKNDLEEHVLTLLSKWRQGALETSLFTLPSIKTISIPPISVKYNDNGINIDLSAQDISLNGLDSFVVESLNVLETPDYLDVSIGFKAAKLTLFAESYKLSGRAFLLITLRGNGAATIDVLDGALQLNIRVANVNGESTAVGDVTLSYTIGQVKANLEKSTLLINDILSKQGPGLLEGLQGDLVNSLKEWAVPLADKYLAKVTLNEMSDIIADLAVNSTVIV